MAIAQPAATDKLNSPSHSKLHRVIASDSEAADESLVVDASGNVNIKTGKQYQVNSVNIQPMTTRGDIIFGGETPAGTPTRLAKGTEGQVLAMGANEPAWVTSTAVLVKATGAEIDTGTDDDKFVTPKALDDQTVLLKKSGGTLTGEVNLGENAGLVYDSALSADGKYSGIVQAGTAGATLAFGDLVYLASADSRWELADADAASTAGDVIIGICVLAANADGDDTKILRMGTVRADAAFPTLTIGAPAYVSTTAGDIQTAKPNGDDDVVRRVGFALTADELYFNPSDDYITYKA